MTGSYISRQTLACEDPQRTSSFNKLKIRERNVFGSLSIGLIPYLVELQWLEHLRTMEINLDMSSWSPYGFIIAPGQKGNGDNIWMSFRSIE